MKNKIQYIISALALTFIFGYTANAQVTAQKIGANPTNISASAVLDIESTNKGVLFPRIALSANTDATTIASPATGLTVYNTATAGTSPNNVTPGYYYWNGTKWTKVATEAEASKWSYEAINARVKLNKLSNGTTDRAGATSFSITDDNVLQIGDMTNLASAALSERGIIVRKTGNASITSISDGGIYSVFENQIYGGNVSGAATYNVFAKSRGSLASPAAVQNGDLIGVFDFRGYSGTGFGNSARIMTRVEGAVTSTSVPVSFEFHTVGPGETLPSQRLKISSNGNVGIGATSPANKLEITQGTAGNSGLRFTNLNSTSTATTSASKVLGLNSTGDVILTNVPGTQNIVSFSTATPTTSGVIFTPNTPNDQSVVYQSAIDNSLWTYNGTTYVTYTAPASTAWNLANTTNDAGSNKTASIWRSGSVGIGTNSPTSLFANTNTQIIGSNAQSSSSATGFSWTNTNAGWAGAFYSTGAFNGLNVKATGTTASTTVFEAGTGITSQNDNAGAGGSTPILKVQGNSVVGINNTAPIATLDITNPLKATTSANANAQVLRLSRPTTSSLKWDNIAQFNLGSYSTAIAANSRLDLALTDGGNATTLTNVMTWQANGNVGINNTAPSAPLVVQGVTGTGALKLIAPSVAAGDNWWMGFGHGTTSTDANDRARIGVDIGAGGPGRLFFTTGAAGAQTRAMFIDESQRVGIGTSSPTSKLEVSTGVTTANSIVNATGSINDFLQYNVQNTSTGTQAQSGYSATANNGTATTGFAWLGINNSNFNFPTSYNIGGANDVSFIGSGQDLYVANANNTKSIIFSTGKATTPFFGEQMRILNNGNVGIGTSSPTSRLEVDGAATNKTAFNAAGGTTIDFSKSNLAYTTANPSAFTLSNLKDGGTYTLAVQGTTAGTAGFTATGFTFKSPNNGLTAAGKETIYTFMVMGTSVYFYMTTGI
jgi:hypothetical protein